jgi:hypothetical protein
MICFGSQVIKSYIKSWKPPCKCYALSEIGEERFFGHSVASVQKAFGVYHLMKAFNLTKSWAGGCIVVV